MYGGHERLREGGSKTQLAKLRTVFSAAEIWFLYSELLDMGGYVNNIT